MKFIPEALTINSLAQFTTFEICIACPWEDTKGRLSIILDAWQARDLQHNKNEKAITMFHMNVVDIYTWNKNYATFKTEPFSTVLIDIDVVSK